MVLRTYVEKKEGLAFEAYSLKADIAGQLGIKTVEDVRIINRYDVEGLDAETFDYACKTVFSEPQLDNCTAELDSDYDVLFAVEYLPGQFDQRASSAAECIQFITKGERPLVKSAKVYLLKGAVSDAELAEIKKYVINPVEAREASLELPETLDIPMDVLRPLKP